MPRKSKKASTSNGEVQMLISALTRLMQSKPASPQQPSRKRRNKKKTRAAKSGVSSEGTITLSRTELLTTLKLAKSSSTVSGNVDILPSSFPFLKGVSKSFDRIRWNSIRLYYKPAVGTTYGGLVSFGMDWDWATNTTDRATVNSLTPNFSCAAWHDSESRPMVLPPNRLQSRAWYTPNGDANWVDKGPGRIRYAADGTSDTSKDVTLGEIWIKYSCTMQGTNPA